LSANDLADADALADANCGPVVVVVPSTQTRNTTTGHTLLTKVSNVL
jgi:hypothetical protein